MTDTVVTRPDLLEVLVPKPSNCNCPLEREALDCPVHALKENPRYDVPTHNPDTDGPLAIICTLDQKTWLWHIFEGTFNHFKSTFKVITPITAHPANMRDPLRMPDQTMRLVIGCAKARGLSTFVP
jgi:hypothetical protein